MGVADARDTIAKAKRDEKSEGILVRNDKNVTNDEKKK
jgi:hypothetical protein